jgi:putative ABC transport system permease protein
LVLMLTHVFDPPPDVMKVPWTYLALLVTAMIAATVAAILHALYRARRAGVDELRTLL